MTNFFAIYLLVIIGVVFMVIAYWQKWAALFIASGLCWALVAMYNFTQAGGSDNQLFVWGFAMFATLMAIFSFLSTIYGRVKSKDLEDKKIDDATHDLDGIIDKEAIELRKHYDDIRRQHRGEDRPYDKTPYDLGPRR